MKRLTWKQPNGGWGLQGADLTALQPAAYGAVYKLMKLEDAMSEPVDQAMKACCDKACGRSDDRTRSECEDCPIMTAVINLQVTSAELAGTAYSYERALDECRIRSAEVSRLKRELANEDGVLWPAWTPVTDRLPENDDCVLAVVSGKPTNNCELVDSIEIASFWRDDGWLLSVFPEWEDPKVSYWMPLPPAPEEVKR